MSYLVLLMVVLLGNGGETDVKQDADKIEQQLLNAGLSPRYFPKEGEKSLYGNCSPLATNLEHILAVYEQTDRRKWQAWGPMVAHMWEHGLNDCFDVRPVKLEKAYQLHMKLGSSKSAARLAEKIGDEALRDLAARTKVDQVNTTQENEIKKQEAVTWYTRAGFTREQINDKFRRFAPGQKLPISSGLLQKQTSTQPDGSRIFSGGRRAVLF